MRCVTRAFTSAPRHSGSVRAPRDRREVGRDFDRFFDFDFGAFFSFNMTSVPPIDRVIRRYDRDRGHHLDQPTSFKIPHTTSSGQCTGNASKGALVNGVSVIILGVTVIFRVLPSPNEYLLSVVPNIIDPSGLMSLLSQCSTCVSRLNVQRPTSPTSRTATPDSAL